VSDYYSLFSQTFYGSLFSYRTMTDVASHVHDKFPVSFLLYIATKKTCQIYQIITVNSSMNAPISDTSHTKNNSCTPCVPMFFKKETTVFILQNMFRHFYVTFSCKCSAVAVIIILISWLTNYSLILARNFSVKS